MDTEWDQNWREEGMYMETVKRKCCLHFITI